VFDEALHVGLFAWLYSDGGPLSLGDRLPANHTDGFLTASLLPHKRDSALVFDTYSCGHPTRDRIALSVISRTGVLLAVNSEGAGRASAVATS
jgi:hypothetical protein